MHAEDDRTVRRDRLREALGRFARRAFRAELASAWTFFLAPALLVFVPLATVLCLHAGLTVTKSAAGFVMAVAAATVVATIGAASRALRRRRSRGRVAFILDDVLAQPDLVSSALEWDRTDDHPMKELTKFRAIEAVSSLRPGEVFPARVSGGLVPALAVTSLVMIVAFLLLSSRPRATPAEEATLESQQASPHAEAHPAPEDARAADATPGDSGGRDDADLAALAATLFRQSIAPPRPAPGPEPERQTPNQDAPSSQDPLDKHGDDPSPDPWDVPEEAAFVPKRLSAKVGKGEYLFETVEMDTGNKTEHSYQALVLRYERRALDMIRQDLVPPEHRDTVRRYFRKIRP